VTLSRFVELAQDQGFTELRRECIDQLPDDRALLAVHDIGIG
jgi:hypothetical protein